MKIREARKEDMPQVLELIRELAIFENEPDAVEINVEVLEREGLGENALFTCFVADASTPLSNRASTPLSNGASIPLSNEEHESIIVGAALVYFRFSTWKGRMLHLEDLIVKESERGSGIGEALYRTVMQYAFDRGLKRVAWDVLDWNQGAIRFYERSGAKLMKDWRVVHMNEEGLRNYIERE